MLKTRSVFSFPASSLLSLFLLLTLAPQGTLGYTLTGEAFKWAGGMDMPAKPEDFEFAKMFWDLATKLITSQQITVHPTKVGTGGLEGVLDGLEQLKEGKVSGVKLVYRIAE